MMDPMTILKGICLASGAAMHVAPLPIMREITVARSTMNYHIAPYASTLLNHLVNLWYAIIRQDGPLIVHRCLGILAQGHYLRTYLTFCPPIKAADNRKWITWVFAVLAAIFFDLHFLLPMMNWSKQYNSHIALYGAITGVGLAAAPLATVGEVLRTRDASSLPVQLCIMVTVQCTAWSVYGWLRDDWSTFLNNIVGVALGSIQLGLIYTFGSSRASTGGAAGASFKSIGRASNAGVSGAEDGVSVESEGAPMLASASLSLGDRAIAVGSRSAAVDRVLISSPTVQVGSAGIAHADVESAGSASRVPNSLASLLPEVVRAGSEGAGLTARGGLIGAYADRDKQR